MTRFPDTMALLSGNIVFHTLSRRLMSKWIESGATREDLNSFLSSIRMELLNVHSDETLNSRQELSLVDQMLGYLDEFTTEFTDE
ncbi:hypothetical protein N183_36330 [Sinorhizobium sp. Sb3]|uniref:hypothetical protein n=1 Tax=Sinorhizobium sp. Sb3 TaxID=1358417 RepID=UPI00071D1DCE|nr:hypothetical protein [Sinorhizobium sp. Sb3]KSV63110.1 hypothetical protein N183_36330 [Sinorhizobium sp. Sb3]